MMQYDKYIEQIASSGSYFLYDLDALESHAVRLSKSSARLFYACKANPLSALLSTLHRAGIHFDVSSEGELQQIHSLGVPGKHILLTGPAKSEALIQLALTYKVGTFVIESPNQLSILQRLASRCAYQPHILLRLQIQGLSEESSVLGGTHTTAFGMDTEVVSRLLPKIKLPVLGFHVFAWSNLLTIDKLRTYWHRAAEHCHRLLPNLSVIDLGGGIGIPYTNETPLLWEDIELLIKEIKQTYTLKELWIEMGRYFTGPFGVYITKVIDRKRTHTKEILVLEGGMNHMARPALLQQPFPVFLLRSSCEAKQLFQLHGPLCTHLDHWGTHLLPSDVVPGDILVFKQVGAYGFTESMPFFLCHSLAGEAVIEKKRLKVIREVQTAQSWLK